MLKLVRRYSAKAGIGDGGVAPHSLRATAGTNALEGGADLNEVRSWMGHANVSTTTLYDKRRERPEDSPHFQGELPAPAQPVDRSILFSLKMKAVSG